MKKILLAFVVMSSYLTGYTTSSYAEDGYQVIPFKAELTKQSLNFDKKNLFAVTLPDYVVEGTKFYGIKGSFTTKTLQYIVSGKDKTNSETLFNLLSSTTDACPSQGEVADGYNVIFNKYGGYSYNTAIVKQNVAGVQTFNYDYKLSDGIPMKFGKGRCVFLSMDGSDFANQNYTMKADLNLIIKVPNPKAVKTYSLDGEFSPGIYPLVSYVVIPVTKDGANNTVPAGTLTSVYGNASMMNPLATLKNWQGHNQIAVYKNGSCQEAFLNHSPTKFMWQDTESSMHGLGNSINWSTSNVVSDMTLSGSGRGVDIKQMSGNNKLPIHLEAGDCVAHAIVNTFDQPTDNTFQFNQETQTHFTVIPD
ncbi:hypothetical protein [Commensalibacter nepenthis]|uniref:Uncharacterized protein n=1 Tax=Commensalibacter nepenthis TaxID=3043872 RepID=A0ABT6Q523_9PROT|nr:hypothetical protein [Commensalibacter sp. TBRC 10068]MDI2111992.1 hypothetical protein [Commensalibacter sp. TBRC 10068]